MPETAGNGTFAAELERLRVERDITPADLARALGASPSDVSRWRRGGGISITNVRALADLFGEPWPKWERLAGYPVKDEPESDAGGVPVLEIHGELSAEDQAAVENYLGLDEDDRRAFGKVLRLAPKGTPRGGKPRIRILTRPNARDGAYKHPFAYTPRSGLVVPLHAGRRAA